MRFREEIERIIGKIKEKEITGRDANISSRYGVFGHDIKYSEVVESESKKINALIEERLRINSDDCILVLPVPYRRDFLYEKLKEMYKEKGFNTFFVGHENVKSIPSGRRFLFISWDLQEQED